MQTVSTVKVVNQAEAAERPLPPRVQEALGQLVGAAKEGLLALSVSVGLGVLSEMMAEEIEDVCGPKGKHNPDRTAYRHGTDDGTVTLGGRRVPVARPRMRTKDGEQELPLRTYEHFADRDPLGAGRAGADARRRLHAPLPAHAGTGRRAGRAAGTINVEELSVQDVQGAHQAGACGVDGPVAGRYAPRGDDDRRAGAAGPDDHRRARYHDRGREGPARAVGGRYRERHVVKALLADLVDRGLDPAQGMLFVIDGSKALRKAIRSVFGERVPVQRCVIHKYRNVMDHLPESERPAVQARLRRAWSETDYDRALDQLKRLAADLERTHPGAAGSLREGMEETLTVTRLGITGKLRRTLACTNPCESMIDTVRRTQRNVKRWRDGEMGMRWTAAGMLEAEKQFRKVIGYTQLPELAIAIERQLTLPQPDTAQTEEADTLIAA
jgi:hypothetical protein